MKHTRLILHKFGICDWVYLGGFRKCRICNRLEHWEGSHPMAGDESWDDVSNNQEAVSDYNELDDLLKGKE